MPKVRPQRRLRQTVTLLALAAAVAHAQALEAPLAADTDVSDLQPSQNFGSLPTLNVGGGAGQFIGVDVTAQVRAWIANPASNFGWGITAALSAPGTVAFFDSKENTAAGHVAQLDLTLADQGPSGPQRATGGKGDTDARGDIGPAGAPGAKGDAGGVGARGDPGAPGAKGEQGIQGLQGPQGSTGAQGAAGPVNISDVAHAFSLAAGTGAAVEATCPGGSTVVGGSCGYLPLDAGLFKVRVAYAGIDGRLNYRCAAYHTGTVTRTINCGAICASFSSATGP